MSWVGLGGYRLDNDARGSMMELLKRWHGQKFGQKCFLFRMDEWVVVSGWNSWYQPIGLGREMLGRSVS